MVWRAPSNTNALLLLLLLTSTLLSLVDSQSSSQQRRYLSPNYADDGHRRTAEVPIPEDREGHRVTGLPYLDPAFTTPHYAGLLPASADSNKYLFYWLFHPDTTGYKGREEDIPLILWLNGGPGCSSMDGLFLENGPLILTHDKTSWKIVGRDASWHKSPAYVVYVDQPVGTGLSFTTTSSYPRNDEQVNQDFYYFLKQFFDLHKDVFLLPDGSTLKRPFFFSGESHAGHYIPSMIAYIDRQNDVPNTVPQIPVAGAAIGNGWTDPYHQYAGAAAAYGYGLIDLAQKNDLDAKEKQCQLGLSKKRYQTGVCFSILDDILTEAEGDRAPYRISQYDVTKVESRHGKREFPPGHKDVESYLGGFPTYGGAPPMNDHDLFAVLDAIHARPSREAGQVYQECTDPPYNALSHQDGKGVVQETVAILNSGKRMLFFNGVLDLICNHVGNEVMLQEMPWQYQNDWTVAKRYAWVAPSDPKAVKPAGYIKEFKNLLYLKVMNSGHMVPLDVPEIALDMIRTFVHHGSFTSRLQKLGRTASPVPASCPVCLDCEEAAPPPKIDDSKTDSSKDSTNEGDDKNSKPADDVENLQTFTFARFWVVGAMGLSMICGYFVGRRSGKSASSSNGNRSTFRSQEVEMNAGMYRNDLQGFRNDDDDDDDDDEEEEEHKQYPNISLI